MSNASDFVIKDGVLKKYKGSGRKVVIPDGVTEIGDNAFRACSRLSSVTIPECVSSLGKTVFKECKGLRSVYFSNGLKSVGNRCFEGCSALKSVVLPDSISSMGAYVFAYCTNLVNITLPRNLKEIGQRMFLGCERLEEINFPEKLDSIETAAFWFCDNLKNINLPKSIRSIGDCAFQYSGLTSVEIPESVTYIGEKAFDSKTKIKIIMFGTPDLDKDCIKDAFLAPHMPLNKISAPTLKHLAVLGWILSTEHDPCVDEKVEKSFQKYWETRLDAYIDEIKQDDRILPALVEKQILTLDQTDKLLELFSENAEVTAMLLDYKNQKFSNETIEANEEKKIEKEIRGPSMAAVLRKNWISRTLFDDTVQLNSYKGEDVEVVVPEQIGRKSVSRIGDYCFNPSADAWTTNRRVNNKETRYQITSVTIPGQIKEIGIRAFEGCWGLENIVLNEGLLYIGEEAFCWCKTLKTVVIPQSVECIFYGAFFGCEKLTDIYILSAETKLGVIKATTIGNCYIDRRRNLQGPKGVFDYCPNLTIHAPAGSYAEQYAKEHDIPFVAE